MIFQQTTFFRSQLQGFPFIVHRFYAGKELLVEADIVGMFRQCRSQLFCYFFQRVAGFRTQQVKKHGSNPVEGLPGMLQS